MPPRKYRGTNGNQCVPSRDALLVSVFYLAVWLLAAVPLLGSPLGQYPVVDAAWHDAWAKETASGNVFIYAPYFRAPLYPLTLGLVYLLSGGKYISGVLLSLFFGLLSVHLVHRIVFRRAGRLPSLVAALVWALNGTALFYSTTLLITPMYVFLLLLSFFLLDRENPLPLGWFVLGLAVTARPGALLLFLPALLLYRRAWRSSWLFALPLVLVWLVNMTHGDGLTVVSSQGGINFYIGNGPDADGFTAYAPAGSGMPVDSVPYIDNVWAASYAPFERGVLPSAVSSWWFGKTVEYIVSHPVNSLFLMAKKLLYLISPVALPSNYDVYYCSRYSPVLRVLTGTPFFPVSGLLLWGMIPGALAAGKLKGTEKNLLLWIVFLSAGIISFFVTARFGLPVAAFLVILLVPRVLRNLRKSLALAPLGLLAGLGLVFLTAGAVERGGVNMAFYDGVAHYESGDEHRAGLLFLEAVGVAFSRTDGVDMNGVDALYNLGVICAGRGDLTGAKMYWEMAVERDPGFSPAREALLGVSRVSM